MSSPAQTAGGITLYPKQREHWQRVAGILKRYLNQTKSNNSILIAISELAEQRLQPAESRNIESLKAAKAALETHIYGRDLSDD
jgi:hypothetical protein